MGSLLNEQGRKRLYTVTICQIYTSIKFTPSLSKSKRCYKFDNRKYKLKYLTIIPRARMGSESIAHEAEGGMGYWLRGHEGERNNCFSKIQLVGQKYRE